MKKMFLRQSFSSHHRSSGRLSRLTRVGAVLLTTLAASTSAIAAEAFPTKAVRIVVPFGAGGSADGTARVLADLLKAKWNQPVIVENRPGAGTVIGATEVARAEPDGYTLLLAPNTTLALMPMLKSNLPYDPQKDFAPVTVLLQFPLALVANKALGVTNIKQLDELAKTRRLTYGSHGPGSDPHLFMELFKSATGLDIKHIPYAGAAESSRALLSGEVDMSFAGTSNTGNLMQTGKVVILARDIVPTDRFPKEVPTFADEGYPNVRAYTWFGIVAPAGTSGDVIATLNKDIVAALQDPMMKSQLAKTGFEGVGSSAEEMRSLVKTSAEEWAPIIEKAGLKVD